VSDISKLNKPPIREAIVDIQIQPFLPNDKAVFEPLRSLIMADFPFVEETNVFEQSFQLGPEGPKGESINRFHGLIFKSEDQKTVVQCRVDGFTVNKLPPYASWESIFPKALACWEHYRDVLKPELISRLSVRYINELAIMTTPSELNTFLTIAPNLVPIEENLSISQFFHNQGIVLSDSGIQANLTLAYQGESRENKPVIILDVECYYLQNVNPHDSSHLSELFGHLRNAKNKLFFGSITDKAKESFDDNSLV
jgi:uncharacterized protein (TIGR04255 family)